jgi:2-methylcitrate dehydratase PrpD
LPPNRSGGEQDQKQEAGMYQPSSYQMAQSRIADMHGQAARRALARTARQARRTPAQDGSTPVTRVLAERLRAVARLRTA